MKFFKKQKKVTTAVPHKDGEIGDSVLRDWALVLGAFAVLILVAILGDGYLLLRINEGNFFTATSEDSALSPETINRKTLLDVSNFFETRQKEYNALRSATSTDIDPSL